MKFLFFIRFFLGSVFLLCLTDLFSQNSYEQSIEYRNQGMYDSSLYYFNVTLKHDDQLHTPLILLERGKTYQLSQNYDFALVDFLQALSLSQKSNDTDTKMKTYVYLAEFYRHLNKHKEAKKYLGLAENLENHSTVSYQTKAQFYNRKAAILAETSVDKKEIIQLSKQAIEISKKYGYPDVEVSSLNQLGYFFSGDTVGLNYYKKALAILEKHKDLRTEVDVLINISRFYQLNGGPYDEGIKYVNKGLELCKGKQWYFALKELHHIKASCYHMQQDYKKANEELVFVLDYTEKNLNAQFEKDLQDVQTKYQVEQKDLILANEKKKTEILKQESVTKSQRINAIVIIVLLLVLFLTVSVYYYLKIRRTNKNLLISNNQKDILIQEVHHRVKNNFQIISGLMNMQLKSISDPESQKVFQEAVQRIHSMALIHQQLYSGDNFDRVQIVEFLTEILRALAHSDLRSQDFFKVEGDNPLMHIEQAVPLGMIIHELAVNSIKYAWDERKNQKINIRIELHDEQLTVYYNDNGKGLPPGFNLKNSKSLGLRLVDLFIHRQLKGNLIYGNKQGAHFKLTFTCR